MNILHGVEILIFLFKIRIIDYVQKKSKWCVTQKEIHKINGIKLEKLDNVSMDDAENECSLTSNCAMFYDVGSLKTNYKFCHNDSEVRDSSVSSTLYVKCRL